jgi:hypothetical protein
LEIPHQGETVDTDPNEVYYAQLDSLLGKHVDQMGLVDYKTLSKDPAFAKVRKSMLSLFPSNAWKRDEQMAYWINLYNVTVLNQICDHYPLKSIMDIENVFDKLTVEMGEKKYSLNQLEKVILKKFNDPRIHFAINCGAKSCPPLMNKAFRAATLSKVLRSRAVAFINDLNHNTILADQMTLSKIFEWYLEDFTMNNTTLISFINQYSKVQVKTGVKPSYLEYDWDLNKK